ncbi:helix-turn-helix domain-containing protein [Bacillus subtilis]|uniref:helix-turn-helix domain-containing protein n=1 Tax=Bacillus subtilis TaxID=1423 RepID=UPI0007AF52CC|nr:helix-turn-helix transcriptional regulator [Bacillus subtilis]
MSNNPYKLDNLPKIMREVRKAIGFTQFQLGQLLGGKDQRYVSDVENGLSTLTPELCIKWFEVCGAYEHIDLVHYLFRLHPRATAPVDPALNVSPSKALINFMKQTKESIEAAENIALWLANERPGRVEALPMSDLKEILDLGPAIDTLFYALSRSHGLKMQELAEKWTRKALMDQVAMSKQEERQAMLV